MRAVRGVISGMCPGTRGVISGMCPGTRGVISGMCPGTRSGEKTRFYPRGVKKKIWKLSRPSLGRFSARIVPKPEEKLIKFAFGLFPCAPCAGSFPECAPGPAGSFPECALGPALVKKRVFTREVSKKKSGSSLARVSGGLPRGLSPKPRKSS